MYTYKVQNKINTSVLQEGSKPIHLASARGDLQMTRALIRMGSDPTACTENEVHQLYILKLYSSMHACPLCRYDGNQFTLLVHVVTRSYFVSLLAHME